MHTISQLKRGAMVSDVGSLLAKVVHTGKLLVDDATQIGRALEHIRRDAEGLLSELETHYYASDVQNPDGSSSSGGKDGGEGAAALAQLCAQVLQMGPGPHGGASS